MYTTKKFQRPRAKQVKRSHIKRPGLDAQKMKALARGHWPEIFQALAPSLNSALDQLGRHIPCPVHGGKNGFRLFKDVAETGGGDSHTSKIGRSIRYDIDDVLKYMEARKITPEG